MNYLEVVSNNFFYLTVWTLIIAAAVIISYIIYAPNLIQNQRSRTIVLILIITVFMGIISTELLIQYGVFLDGLAKL